MTMAMNMNMNMDMNMDMSMSMNMNMSDAAQVKNGDAAEQRCVEASVRV